jgi:hypothetical protein
MIEWRWGLDPLTQRDANAKNLAEVLDFSSTRTDSPDVPVLASFASVLCGPSSVAKAPPAPVSAPTQTSPDDPAATTSAAAESSDANPRSLARTGGATPFLVAGAAAVTGGMALRAAHRRAELAVQQDASQEP